MEDAATFVTLCGLPRDASGTTSVPVADNAWREARGLACIPGGCFRILLEPHLSRTSRNPERCSKSGVSPARAPSWLASGRAPGVAVRTERVALARGGRECQPGEARMGS